MNDTLQRQLMIHVERIVRPIRAHDRRKLAMRRELLAHLNAAMQEEQELGKDENTALETARQRLGAPAELTRTLQRSVPMIERTLRGIVPAPRWLTQWEHRRARNIGTHHMTLAQTGLSCLGAMLLSYGVIILQAAVVMGKYRPALQLALADHTWIYPVGHILANTLLVLFLWSCFRLLGRTVRRTPTAQTLFAYGTAMAAMLMAWVLIVITMIASKTPDWPELVSCLPAAAIVVAGFVGLGRIVARLGVGYAEWLSLEIE